MFVRSEEGRWVMIRSEEVNCNFYFSLFERQGHPSFGGLRSVSLTFYPDVTRERKSKQARGGRKGNPTFVMHNSIAIALYLENIYKKYSSTFLKVLSSDFTCPYNSSSVCFVSKPVTVTSMNSNKCC